MASTRNLMKFTDIVRDHYRGPAYGQEFTTWYTKVQHGFSTAQVPESAQVDHLVAVLDSPAQELAFSFIKKYNAEHPTEGLRGQQLVQYHEDKLEPRGPGRAPAVQVVGRGHSTGASSSQ